MRLIDADKLIAYCKKAANDEWNQRIFPTSWAYAYEDFIEDIENQDTVQPQGIDKDRLIEELEAIKFDDVAFSDMREGWNLGVKKAIRIVKKQPTTDGWIPVSSGKLPKVKDRLQFVKSLRSMRKNDRT